MFDFYFLLPDSSEFKLELIRHILTNICNKKYTFVPKYNTALNRILLDVNRKELCNNNDNSLIYNSYFEFLQQTHNYHLLKWVYYYTYIYYYLYNYSSGADCKKINTKIKQLYNQDATLPLEHAYFYIRFTNFNTCENNEKQTLEFKRFNEMKQENELIKDIKTLNIEKINRLKGDEFDSVYGVGSSKIKLL